MTVRVPLVEQRDASYDILIGPGLLQQLDRILADYCPAAAYAIISDSHVGKLYGEDLLAALQHEYLENDLFPSTDITEDWLKLTDFDPDNVIKLGPIRPRKIDTIGNAIV